MPLRAVLDGDEIHAFAYDSSEWNALKQAYRNQELRTHCCGNRAIPKTSKLSNHFFAHARRGECTSARETPEHIYLKTLFARAAQRAGWAVTTECPGETPQGERWIADVYAERGNARIAIEIQWSQQSREEFDARQARYRASGVRAAWLYRIDSRRWYWFLHNPSSRDLPLFHLTWQNREKRQLNVKEFDLEVELFAEALMEGRVTWRPRPQDVLTAGLLTGTERCWRCAKASERALGLILWDSDGVEIDYLSFRKDGIPEVISRHLSGAALARHGIGPIKPRSSRTVGRAYMSNGCRHCDALFGNFYHREHELEFVTGYPDPVETFRLPCQEIPGIQGFWHLSDGNSPPQQEPLAEPGVAPDAERH